MTWVFKSRCPFLAVVGRWDHGKWSERCNVAGFEDGGEGAMSKGRQEASRSWKRKYQ